MNQTESSIIKKLRSYFQNGYNYRIDNSFIFSYDWESDFFCVNREGYSFEFEVKISRSDFKADFLKRKHEIFRKGSYTETFNGESREVEKKFIPNRFYYAVPSGLLSLEEIPQYAGLITCSEIGRIEIIKRAPFIHRRKLNFSKVLCDKFYHRWINEIRSNNLMTRDIRNLREEIEAMKSNSFQNGNSSN